ncbi:MAG: 50S ribosomal protein L25 [Candidatus Aminicenantales bacterium]
MIIKSERRDIFGKNAARRIRKEGLVPAILYGEKENPIPLILNKKDIFKILKSETGENTIFKVAFDSEKRDTMIKELQIDPTTDELLHTDLIQIAMDKDIRVSVPIVPEGEPIGVKTEGGFVEFMTREIEIECLPKNIPEHVTIEISHLHLHQSIKAGDVILPEGVKLISDPNSVLVLIEVPHKEEEVEVKAPEEEVIAEEKEPEVIKKERPEKEEEKE